MAKSLKEKAREGIKEYEAMKAKRKSSPKPVPMPKKKGKPANWLTRLKARVKVELAKRAQKKAYKNLDAAKKRDAYTSMRTEQVTSALKKAGVSDKKIARMRGRRN